MCQSGCVEQPLKRIGASTMKITTVGIDLAKNVFQVHGIDGRGKGVLRKQLRRAQVAVFVPIKNIEQQAILSVHRVRQGFVKARTAQANQIRGLLGEFGLVIPQGIYNVAKRVPELLEDADKELPVPFRHLIERLTQHLKELDRQVKEFEREIIAWHRSSELSCKLEKIPGIGPLAASALVASIADPHSFDNGRQVSAWLGLVPRQHSSGGKPTLLGMSKRGDAYLRTLLIHGAH